MKKRAGACQQRGIRRRCPWRRAGCPARPPSGAGAPTTCRCGPRRSAPVCGHRSMSKTIKQRELFVIANYFHFTECPAYQQAQCAWQSNCATRRHCHFYTVPRQVALGVAETLSKEMRASSMMSMMLCWLQILRSDCRKPGGGVRNPPCVNHADKNTAISATLPSMSYFAKHCQPGCTELLNQVRHSEATHPWHPQLIAQHESGK